MKVTNQQWIQRSRARKEDGQKKVLAQALQKPMTASELLAVMHKVHPKMILRDVTRLLRGFEKRKLIRCLTPKETESRYYFFTDSGRRLVRKVFGFSAKPLPRLVNWPKYGRVLRGNVRRLVLLELNAARNENDKTITGVRMKLNEKYRIAVGAVGRALRELKQLNLIRQIGLTRKRNRPIYQPTLIGKRIIKLIALENSHSQSSDGKALKKPQPLEKHEEETYTQKHEGGCDLDC
jgi:DNA-binding MarR family transcriptional regulator